MGYQYRIFAEELDEPEIAGRIRDQLQGEPVSLHVKSSAQEFRENWDRSLSVLIDSIDGTTNFNAGIPFFCSAVAIFVGGRLSIGAIYDPFHNQVFYGSLRVLPGGDLVPVARVWTIQSGNVEDLGSRPTSSNIAAGIYVDCRHGLRLVDNDVTA